MPTSSNYFVVIPARFNSSRFPGKPLANIAGKKLVERVYERCIAFFPPEKVYVATDDQQIREFCLSKNINVCMTSSDCLTGTDRVAEFATHFPATFYINVQGDEPLVTREDLEAIYNEAVKNPSLIINGMCDIKSAEHFFSVNVPKVVTAKDQSLIYMSRAGIPSNKAQIFNWGKRQVCIYSFPADTLSIFSSIKSKTPLEEQEDIEILRFVELGLKIKMINLSDSTFAVDIPSDVEIIENELRRRGEA